MNHTPITTGAPATRLNRVLSFPLVLLYGLGVTIGAGIYVLVGETTSRAGSLAPFAFALAALVMIFPALSFSELAVRYPFASGSAQYAEEGLKSRLAGFCVGMAVIAAGLVTAATIHLAPRGIFRTSYRCRLGFSLPLSFWQWGESGHRELGAEALAEQSAPLSFLFSKTTGLPPLAIPLIAVVATLNGVIVQIIMISRLSYGLSSRRLLPQFLSQVNERARTPLYATALATASILGLALSLHIVTLAEWTSRIILVVFAIVCLSLLRLKLRGEPAPEGAFRTPTWVPAAGVIACLALLGLDFLVG